MEHRTVSQSPEACQHRVEIEAEFVNMLKEVPYHNLSISELCQRLGISRKIFYRCYQSKDACLNAVIDNTLRNSLLYNATQMEQWDGSVENCQVVMEFWKSQKIFLDMIIYNDLTKIMFSRAIEFASSEDNTASTMLDKEGVPCDIDILSYHICGHFSLILQWYFRGFDTPAPEMAQKYYRAIHSPMIQHKQKN